MNLQLLHSEFPYICGKFDFLFYQCVFWRTNFLYSVLMLSIQIIARHLFCRFFYTNSYVVNGLIKVLFMYNFFKNGWPSMLLSESMARVVRLSARRRRAMSRPTGISPITVITRRLSRCFSCSCSSSRPSSLANASVVVNYLQFFERFLFSRGNQEKKIFVSLDSSFILSRIKRNWNGIVLFVKTDILDYLKTLIPTLLIFWENYSSVSQSYWKITSQFWAKVYSVCSI